MHETDPAAAPRRRSRRRRTGLVLVATLTLVLAACNIGKKGPTYVQAADPTVSKPQSKLWFNDGHWWAAMLETGSQGSSGNYDADVTIHRLTPDGWVSTGVDIDTRGTTKVDVVSSGGTLWTVAHKRTGTASGVPEPSSSNRTFVNRFTYDAATDTYSPVAGFPREMNPYSMESITIDVDSAGVLWAAWVQAQQVVWQRSTDGGTTWSAATALTDPHASTSTDDVASLVAFGTQVGIMWSDQAAGNDGFWFTTASAGAGAVTWSAAEAAYVGAGIGDDHLNLKADGGTVYAVVKTRIDTGSNPNVVLLRRSGPSSWTARTVWVGSDNVTRPVVQLDTTNGLALVFATGPNAAGEGDGENGGAVYRKVAPLASGAFTAGLGTKVMGRGDTGTINDVTGTKQTVGSGSGVVVLAADAAVMTYWYAEDPLTTPPT